MTSEQILDIVKKKEPDQLFQISFKTRASMTGLFLKTADYPELSRKNLWRIVSGKNLEEFKTTSNGNLARIFNGTEFTRLEARIK